MCLIVLVGAEKLMSRASLQKAIECSVQHRDGKQSRSNA